MCVLCESLLGLGEYAPPLKREPCNDGFACVSAQVLQRWMIFQKRKWNLEFTMARPRCHLSTTKIALCLQ